MVFKSYGRFSLGALLLLTVLGVSGCQQRTVGKLLGKWEGRPDTAAARTARESLKYGETTPTAGDSPEAVVPENATDWESFDRIVTLDFVDSEQVEMSLGGGADSGGSRPLTGKWHILATTPVGCTIEVETAGEAGPSEDSAAVVRRQFQLNLDEREGECVGYSLIEVGADRQLGSLYFSRPEGM